MPYAILQESIYLGHSGLFRGTMYHRFEVVQ